MKETGIIMSGNHPKLILDGIKTMTRRVIKFQPEPNHIEEFKETWIRLCRYGQVGDGLWCRETWATEKQYDHLKPSEIPGTAKIYFVNKLTHSAGGYSLFTEMGKVRSAMFMCEWMSRITLEITGIRVERLREIKQVDLYYEGIAKEKSVSYEEAWRTITAFIQLWDSLNAKKYPWSSNPWVWCISFKVV